MLAALAAHRAAARRDDVVESRRALPAEELAPVAEPYFAEIEIEPDPATALARAREHGPVLVTGSLYLLADLSRNDA